MNRHPPSNSSSKSLYLLLGIAGAFVARFIGQAVGFYGTDDNAGFIASLLGAIVLLVIYGAIVKRT